MAATPRLLTSECAAHYPRLWGLIESLSSNRTVRKYPIMLDMISFTQEFEKWVMSTTDHMELITKVSAPARRHTWNHYGADPIVAERLDYFADEIGLMVLKQESIATIMLYDLGDWHHAILQRTAPSELPRYMSSIKCPECQKFAVLKHQSDYFCVNKECQHSWVKA